MGKKIVIGGMVGLLVPGAVAATGNSWWQAKTMRTKVYQPLLQEVTRVESVVRASQVSQAVPSTTYMSLKKGPLWDRVPQDLQNDVQATYEKAWDCQSEMVVVRTHASGLAVFS